jgi:hypothetical protein
MGVLDRRRAGDEAENIWESGKLPENPQTEEEWDEWEAFFKLVKKADGKGINGDDKMPGGPDGTKEFTAGYEAALDSYLDTTYENHYKGADWTREQFDEAYKMYEGTPGGEMFRNGQLGTDLEQLTELGSRAMTSESLGEFIAKRDADQAVGEFDGIEAPDLQEFDPQLYENGDDLDLQVSEFDKMDPSQWSNENSAMHGSLDYMRSIMNGGEDDAANAEWNKRKAEAEQLSRANREASMRGMEVQGMAGSGNELLADLEGQGQLTQSLFNSGLDAAGMQQQRRDAAAGSAYDMGGGIADKQDAWHVMTTQRDDANKVYGDNVANQALTANWGRNNQVLDMNTGAVNNAELYNIGLDQQEFGNAMGLAGAKAGMGVNIANFGGQYDQFNQTLNNQQYEFQQTMPNTWDKIAAGVGVVSDIAGSVIP